MTPIKTTLSPGHQIDFAPQTANESRYLVQARSHISTLIVSAALLLMAHAGIGHEGGYRIAGNAGANSTTLIDGDSGGDDAMIQADAVPAAPAPAPAVRRNRPVVETTTHAAVAPRPAPAAPARRPAAAAATPIRRAPQVKAKTAQAHPKKIKAVPPHRAPKRTTAHPAHPPRLGRVVSKAHQAAAWPLVNRAVAALKAGKYKTALSHYKAAAATDPNNLEARLGVAGTYSILRDYQHSIAAYRPIVAAVPREPRAWRGLADALAYSGRYSEAVTVNNRILAMHPKDFAAAYQNGQVSAWAKNYASADKYFRLALQMRPNDAEAWTQWGNSLAVSERGARARSAFERALAIRPNYAAALVGLGDVYNWNNDYPNAIIRYRAGLALEPRNLKALIGLGDALTFSNQAPLALAPYRTAVAIDPSSRAARLGLGRALIYSQQPEAGESELKHILKYGPNDAEVLKLLADAQSNNADTVAEANQAIANYRKVLTRQKNPNDQALTLAALAQAQTHANDFDGARSSLQDAIKLAPQNTEVATEYARFLVTQDELSEADNVVAGILSRDADNARARTLQVIIQSRLGNFARANALAAQLTTIDPGSTEEALQIAGALHNAGNDAAADRVLEKLVNGKPNDIALQLQVARYQRDSRNWDGAVVSYRRLLVAAPRNTEARLDLAEVLTWQKQFDVAQKEIDATLAIDPQNTRARLLDATISLRADTPQGRTNAEAKANAVLAQDPANPEARNIVSQVLTSRHKFDDAIAGYRAVLKENPNNLDARLGLARNLYYSNQVQESISDYESLVALTPDDTQVKLELAQIYMDRNLLSDAERLYTQVLRTRREPLPPLAATPAVGVDTVTHALVNPSMLMAVGDERLPSQPAPLDLHKNAWTRHGHAAHIRLASTHQTAATRFAQADLPSPAPTTTIGAPSSAPPAAPMPAPMAPAPVTAPPLSPAPAAPAADSVPAPSSTEPVAAKPAAAEPAAPAAAPQVPDLVVPLPATATTGGAIGPEAPLADQVAALRGLGQIRRRQLRYPEATTYFQQALVLDSGDVDSRVGLAQSLRGSADYPQALIETERALATAPDNLLAKVLHAQLLGDTGKPADAQKELDALLNSVPEHPPVETWLTLAQAFSDLRNYDAALQVLDLANKDYPNEPMVQRRIGETYTFAKKWPEALAEFNALIAADPKDAEAMLGKARVNNYSNHLDLAETQYRDTLIIQPDNYQAQVELADVLARRSNYAESIELYRKALATKPEDEAAHVELARVLRYNRQFDLSETELNSVLATNPANVAALTERGILRGQTGNYEPGIADLRKARSIAPDDVTVQFGLAEVLGYARQYDESLRISRAALQREPDNEKGRIEMALVLSYSGDNRTALTEIDKVLTANGQSVSAQIAKAQILSRAGRDADSIALYKVVLAADSTNQSAQLGLAEAYIGAQQYDAAIHQYDTILAADPQNLGVQVARGRALGYAKRYPEGAVYLRNVVTANPTNAAARLALAELETNSGNSAMAHDAVLQYQTVLKADPQNDDARIGYGRALSYSGNYKEAEFQFNDVLHRNPKNDVALVGLADSERFAGRPFDARDNYERALAANASSQPARDGLREVRQLTSASVSGNNALYHDTNGVRVHSYGLGATVRTRQGTIGLTDEHGTFTDANTSMRRRALDLLLQRSFGTIQARLLLNQIKYSGAPDRNLYDFSLQKTFSTRKRIYGLLAQREVVESLAALQNKVMAREATVGLAYPLGSRVDFDASATRLKYSDSNARTTLDADLMYRLMSPQPTVRLGIGFRHDDTRFISPDYYTPQGFGAFSALADYAIDRGRWNSGLSASYPLSSGDAGGVNRPAKTLFGFTNYDLTDAVQLFLNGGLVDAPTFRSQQYNVGATIFFGGH